MKKVILNSGGMDSFLLAKHPKCVGASHVFVDIGQKYVAKELESAIRIAEHCEAELHVEKGAQIACYEHPSGIIPYRNAEMILCAAQHGNVIFLGVLSGEINSDKSPEFFAAMENVLDISHRKQYWSEEDKKHTIQTPLRNKTKAQHIYDFLKSGGSIEHLLQTVSCYDGGKNHCGKCSSCHKRWIALTVATGNAYLQEFNVNPWEAYDLAYLESRMPSYDGQRKTETILAYSMVGIQL